MRMLRLDLVLAALVVAVPIRGLAETLASEQVGAWTVSCDQDAMTDRVNCNMYSPGTTAEGRTFWLVVLYSPEEASMYVSLESNKKTKVVRRRESWMVAFAPSRTPSRLAERDNAPLLRVGRGPVRRADNWTTGPIRTSCGGWTAHSNWRVHREVHLGRSQSTFIPT